MSWSPYFRELYEERAAIMEFMGNMARVDAQRLAWIEVNGLSDKQPIADLSQDSLF